MVDRYLYAYVLDVNDWYYFKYIHMYAV
jgi:hypothetical protein